MLETPRKLLLTPAVLGIIAVAAIASSGYLYVQYRGARQTLVDPQSAAREENRALVARVGQLMELPEEEPTVATVTDKGKLADQPFFAKSENGDKVLIFTEARIAVLYRPATNKIINVAPVNIGEAQAQTQEQEQPVRVALYNGTTVTGLTRTAEDDLRGKLENVEVVARENASQKGYERTVIVDLTGSRAAVVQSIADALGGEVGSLPEGETRPDADILVILGTDYTE